MSKILTPIGVKINEEDLNLVSLERIIELTKFYHKGRYVIGKDTTMQSQVKGKQKPHYHIHFHYDNLLTKNALSAYRTKHFKSLNVPRSFKLYFGQDLPNANPLAWMGYALKEEVIKIEGYDETELTKIDVEKQSQNQIKKLKLIHHEKKTIVENEKKEFKHKLYTYIEEQWNEASRIVEAELQKGNSIWAHNDYSYFVILYSKFYYIEERITSMQPTRMDNLYREYKVKYLLKDDEEKCILWLARKMMKN